MGIGGLILGSGTDTNHLDLQDETKGTDSLVQMEGLDWPLKAERPFPISSSNFKNS